MLKFKFLNTRLNHIELNEINNLSNYIEVNQKELDDIYYKNYDKFIMYKKNRERLTQVITVDGVYICSNSKYKEDILKELRNSSYKSFTNIRQLLADSNINDYTGLYRFLYDNISVYSKGKDGIITVILEEYLFHSNFKIDLEINVMACVARILEQLNKKQVI